MYPSKLKKLTKLEKYLQWDKFADKIGFIPVPSGILRALGDELDGKNIVMFMKGGYDLMRCIETLEDYMRSSGMKSDHELKETCTIS